MHKSASDVAEYIAFAGVVAGWVLLLTSGIGSRYRSANEIPRRVLIRIALIWLPLVLLVVLSQIYHHSTPWLMYVPFPWIYAA